MLKKKRFYFLVLIVLPISLFLAYAAYRIQPTLNYHLSDDQLSAVIQSRNLTTTEVGYFDGELRRLRFMQIGQDTSKPLLVFIHGSPSASTFWFGMFQDTTLRNRANLLAVDRPGYGGSGLGSPVISVQEQASAIAEVIKDRRSPGQKVILHGSSYGGTVSARLAMDFSDLVDGLLLQSASMAPKEEYTYWLSHPTNHWTLSWLMPGAIRSANREKLNHQAELEAMADEWENITATTVILHGTDDWLIFPRNAYYACNKLTNAQDGPTFIHHMVEGKQHDLLYSAPKLLRGYLDYLLDDVTRISPPTTDSTALLSLIR